MTGYISYKQRLKLALAGAALLLIACYNFAFSKSIREYKQYKEHVAVKAAIRNPDQYLHQLEAREEQINNSFGQFTLDTLNPSKNLLGVVSIYCEEHRLQFSEYKPLGIFSGDNLNILTRNIIVEGKFLDCLGLIYELETKKEAGRVSSILFKSYTDPKDKQVHLSCTLTIQNIIPSNENI